MYILKLNYSNQSGTARSTETQAQAFKTMHSTASFGLPLNEQAVRAIKEGYKNSFHFCFTLQ